MGTGRSAGRVDSGLSGRSGLESGRNIPALRRRLETRAKRLSLRRESPSFPALSVRRLPERCRHSLRGDIDHRQGAGAVYLVNDVEGLSVR